MKTKTTTLTELKKDNDRMCLSAKRALSLCWQCNLYPTCESKIANEFFDADMKKAQEITLEYNKKIKSIRRRWQGAFNFNRK